MSDSRRGERVGTHAPIINACTHAETCRCKSTWTSSESGCNVTQSGCPSVACDDDDKSWCLVENSGCAGEENTDGGGWAYCTPGMGTSSIDALLLCTIWCPFSFLLSMCLYLFVCLFVCCYCFVTSLFRMSCFVPLCWFHLSSMLCRMPLTTTFPKTLRKVLWCARKYRFLHPKDREFCTCSLKCASTSATPVGVKEPQTQLSVTANPIPSDCYSEQTAARELGYNQSSWDNSSGEEPQPASDSTPWALLTSKEQEAATFLGYSDKSWDDESGLEAQPAADSKYWAQLSACGEDPCRASPACSRSLFARVT